MTDKLPMAKATVERPAVSTTGPDRLAFTVYGVAEPKGSIRVLPRHGRGFPVTLRTVQELLSSVVATSDNPDVKAWQRAIAKEAWCAQQDLPPIQRGVLQGAVALTVAFYLPRPSGLAKGYLGPHVKKPDLDKLIRAVKDALTSVAWADDSQVSNVSALKAYAAVDERPRAEISIHPIEAPLFAAATKGLPR
jgi:Holliday junction resolvase RusA-like endonuclease